MEYKQKIFEKPESRYVEHEDKYFDFNSQLVYVNTVSTEDGATYIFKFANIHELVDIAGKVYIKFQNKFIHDDTPYWYQLLENNDYNAKDYIKEDINFPYVNMPLFNDLQDGLNLNEGIGELVDKENYYNSEILEQYRDNALESVIDIYFINPDKLAAPYINDDGLKVAIENESEINMYVDRYNVYYLLKYSSESKVFKLQCLNYNVKFDECNE